MKRREMKFVAGAHRLMPDQISTTSSKPVRETTPQGANKQVATKGRAAPTSRRHR